MTDPDETAWRAYTAYCRAQGLDPLPRAAWAGRRAYIWRAVVATVETALDEQRKAIEPVANVRSRSRLGPRWWERDGRAAG